MVLLIVGDSERVDFHSSQPLVRLLLEHFSPLSSPRLPLWPLYQSVSGTRGLGHIITAVCHVCFAEQHNAEGRKKKKKKALLQKIQVPVNISCCNNMILFQLLLLHLLTSHVFSRVNFKWIFIFIVMHHDLKFTMVSESAAIDFSGLWIKSVSTLDFFLPWLLDMNPEAEPGLCT